MVPAMVRAFSFGMELGWHLPRSAGTWVAPSTVRSAGEAARLLTTPRDVTVFLQLTVSCRGRLAPAHCAGDSLPSLERNSKGT